MAKTVSSDSILKVALTSRALFNLKLENDIYETKGLDAYEEYQVAHRDSPPSRGVAFPLIEKLLALNTLAGRNLVEVSIVSRNSAQAGMRIMNAVEHYNLSLIKKHFFTRGAPIDKYLSSYATHLFLSSNPVSVREVLALGIPGAYVREATCDSGDARAEYDSTVRVAFDGDSVLFGDASERIFRRYGIDSFEAHEKDNEHIPMAPGPLKGFAGALHQLQMELRNFGNQKDYIRTALITSRGAPAHKRAIQTMHAWELELDEVFFLAGAPKKPLLDTWKPDIFFDDQEKHLADVDTGAHVLHGVANEQLPIDGLSANAQKNGLVDVQ